VTYLNKDELAVIPFKNLGENVKISSKACLYDVEKIEIGDNSRIDDFCVISGKIVLGKNCHIGPGCIVAGGREGVYFSDFSGLAYAVKIFSQSDDYSGKTLTNPTVPRKYKNEQFSAVYIGKHVIIGVNSVVFPGVKVAEGCSIGAMSLITKSTEPWGVYFGSPARRIKNRRKELLELEEQFNKSE